MMSVRWIKCGNQGERYCLLETVNLDSVVTKGVYIIWQNLAGHVLYVGEGDIKERLLFHRKNEALLAHRGEGALLVTWGCGVP